MGKFHLAYLRRYVRIDTQVTTTSRVSIVHVSKSVEYHECYWRGDLCFASKSAGRHWSVDTTGNSVLNLFAFQVWLSLPSCWVSAWTRCCSFCCNPMGHDIPFGSRTSLQRDLQRCHDVGATYSTQFDIVELKNVLKLARSRGVKTPVSDRVLEALLKGGHPNVEALSEAETVWAKILGNKRGACGLAVHARITISSNLFLHVMKGIFVCCCTYLCFFRAGLTFSNNHSCLNRYSAPFSAESQVRSIAAPHKPARSQSFSGFNRFPT